MTSSLAQDSQDVLNLIMQVQNVDINSPQHSLTSVFVDKLELAFQLSHYLSLSDILLKVALLNKQFSKTVNNLKQYNAVWTLKIVLEWVSVHDRISPNKPLSSNSPDDHGMDEVEQYPWIMGLVEEYLEESQDDEVKMF